VEARAAHARIRPVSPPLQPVSFVCPRPLPLLRLLQVGIRGEGAEQQSVQCALAPVVELDVEERLL
jgi:hypothetical protein